VRSIHAVPGRSDLLEYLTRYAALGNHVVGRTERWRRRRWRFDTIAREADRVASELGALGVGSGDRVALHLEEGPLWHAAFFGALRAGAVAVPLDAALEPARLRELVQGLDLRAWCTEREVAELALDLPRVELAWRPARAAGAAPPWPDDDPERVAQIVLTSGTSGAPQAVPVTHRNMRSVLDALEAGIAPYRRWLWIGPRLRIAVALPLSHLYGQVMAVFGPAMLAADVALLPPMPAAEMARALRRERAWALATVPRTLSLLAEHLHATAVAAWGEEGFVARLEAARGLPWWRRWLVFRSLHRELGYRMVGIVSGGAALGPDLESLWRNLGFAVVQGYGLTETAPLVTIEHPFDHAPGSLGRPLPGVEVRIAGDGEILVRGPNVAPARLGGPAVDSEGWLHTGDLGRLEDGRLVYLGRKGERIVTPAGVNVDPEPIVDRLKAQPSIVDAVVLERPWGKPGIVCAVLALRPGSDAEAAIAAVNAGLPDAARIRSWHVWPEPDFPRTRTGKPRRPDIRTWLAAQAPEEAEPTEPAVERAAPVDPVAALVAMTAGIAGLPADRISADDRLGDVLTSLDRVELATRLEVAYGATLGLEAFAGERTLREVAEEAFTNGHGPSATAVATMAIGEEEAEPPIAVERPAPEVPPATPPSPAEPAPVRRTAHEAPWRNALPVRAARHVVREVVVRGFWHPAIETRAGGLERLRGLEPPFLLASNHLSILDPLAILFALPWKLRRRLAPSAMWEHFGRPGKLWEYWLAVLGLNLVPLVQVGDWRPTLRVAGGLADRGWCPLLFPEGARSDDGHLLPFRLGVAIMARELHLPIVPCAVMGTLAVMPRGAHWFHHCWIGRAPVAVRLGEPIPTPRPDDEPQAIVDELARRIEALRVEALAAAGRP
jgi:long-chain acyl-CoA synthetase